MYIPHPLHDGFLPGWALAADASLMPVEDTLNLVRSNRAEGKANSATVCELRFLCELRFFGTVEERYSSQRIISCDRSRPVLLFSNLIQIIFGYFDPENIFLDIKNKYFSG